MTHLRMADLELAAEAKIQVPVGQGRQTMKAAWTDRKLKNARPT